MRKILVVDDDDGVREAVAALLEQHGCEVLQAANAAEGFSTTFHEQPEIVLLDCMLGRDSGLDLLRCIKATPEIAHVRVLMISGMAGAATVAEEYGAEGLLLKPFAVDELLSRLRPVTPQLGRRVLSSSRVPSAQGQSIPGADTVSAGR